MRIRGKAVLVTLSVALVIILLVVVSIVYSMPPNLPPSCANDSQFTENGFSYVCGNGSASDGRLIIVVHNHHFAQARNIPFQPPSSVGPADVFLLINVSISNVGGGNTSVGGAFFVQVTDGSPQSIGNGEYIDNVSFPNEYPNYSMPENSGGLYLPPGAKADLWLLFYLPIQGTENNQTTISLSNLQLQYLLFNELGYGGYYNDNGSFGCGPCETLKVKFIIDT